MTDTGNPVILTYHSISEGRSPLKIAPAIFAQQMEWLAGNARVVSLGTLIDHLRAQKPLPARTVALTFDDGFADFHSDAAAVLTKLRLPATVFLPTRYVGGLSNWPGQPNWVEPQPLMSWQQVAELAGEMIQFGSHSVTHPDLSALPPASVEEEAIASQREIVQRTGQPAEFFCYPYGRWSPAARDVIARRYRGACSTEAALLRPGCDAYALPRVDAHYVRDMGLFQKMFAGPFRVYVATRRIIRRLQGQPEGGY